MLHAECAKKRKVNCVQRMHFHELASHFYGPLIFMHKLQSACDEIEQVKRFTQEKGSKRSNAFYVTRDACLGVFLQ